ARRDRAAAAGRDAPHHRRQQDAGGEATRDRRAHGGAQARTSRRRRRGGRRPAVKALLLTREYPPHVYGGAGVVAGPLAQAPAKADQLGSGYLLSRWIEKTGVEAADRVIAVSHRMREDILAHFRVDPERVVVIHNGIDPDQFRRTENRDVLARYGIREPYVLF